MYSSDFFDSSDLVLELDIDDFTLMIVVRTRYLGVIGIVIIVRSHKLEIELLCIVCVSSAG